jgi:hypothetical protein
MNANGLTEATLHTEKALLAARLHVTVAVENSLLAKDGTVKCANMTYAKIALPK